MHKIGIIGDKDSIFGFKTLGIDVYPVEENPEDILEKLISENYAVIFMTESEYLKHKVEILKYVESPLPAIIPIPNNGKNLNVGMSMISKAVEKAIGADILFKEE